MPPPPARLPFFYPIWLVSLTLYSQHLLAGMSAQQSWALCALRTAEIAHPFPQPLAWCIKPSRHPINLYWLKNEYHVSSGLRKHLSAGRNWIA